MNYIMHCASPLGPITLSSDGRALTGLWFEGQKYFGSTLGSAFEERSLPVFSETERWLSLYFAGKDPDFTPPLSFHDTPFREEVWSILLTIPYGRTMTYREIADRIALRRGLPRMSARAVGGAVGRNPVSIIVPCHRVIASDGSLTGYAGGLERKKYLLEKEKADIRPAG